MNAPITTAARLLGASGLLAGALLIAAQDANAPRRERFQGPPPGGPGPGDRFMGPGPGGPPPEVKLLKQFDLDKNKLLDKAERQKAREHLAANPPPRRGFGGPGGPGGFGGRGPRAENAEPAQPGEKLTSKDVRHYPDAPFYDRTIVRTLFLEFESHDWEKELADFNNTDVEVPAKLTVDGKTYDQVGVHYRGASSFFTTPEDRKRSLNLSLDFVKDGQNVHGYRTLNLLNSHTDPSFLRTVLYYTVAADYIPAPKANFVRVVVNGENWGVYVNAQQFNKEFLQENFGTTKGARWKVPGSPGGRGGLVYISENHSDYEGVYEIKSKDDPRAWNALLILCKVLKETPSAELAKALEPILDIEGALKFLAIENALMNADGYWVRASDYNLYLDEKGRFHLVPHDANETFRAAGGGPGMPRPEPGKEFELSPFAGSEDPNKPLLNKLLAVPELRSRYLSYVRDIAERWLDWSKLGPIAEAHHKLIADDVRRDTRKLASDEAFAKSLTAPPAPAQVASDERGFRGRGPGGPSPSLKTFADKRREFLLSHPEVKQAAPLKRASN